VGSGEDDAGTDAWNDDGALAETLADAPSAEAPVDTSPGTDVAIDAAIDGWSAPLTLASGGSGCTHTFAFPNAGGDGRYIAARLSPPPSYPFRVESAAYHVDAGIRAGGEHCLANIAHAFVIFQDSGTDPPATPTILATVDVPAASTSTPHTITMPVAPPVVV